MQWLHCYAVAFQIRFSDPVITRGCNIMFAPTIEVVEDAIKCQLGEGPHWCPKEHVLYYVDITLGRVLRYDPEAKVGSYATVSQPSLAKISTPSKKKSLRHCAVVILLSTFFGSWAASSRLRHSQCVWIKG